MTAPTAAPIKAVDPNDRIRAEEIAALFRSAPAGLNAALVGAFALAGALLYIDALGPRPLLAWLAFVVADFALRQALCRWVHRRRPPRADWPRWAFAFTAASLLGGLVWGVGGVVLLTPDTTEQLIVILFVSSTASGAVPAFGSYLLATYAYSMPAMLPFMLWSAGRGDALHHALVAMGFVFIGAFMFLARRFNLSLRASLLLRFANLDLLDDVQRQKEIAEQANIAKSRFLAAASHDLRQPVHALGMFVSALRGRPMDAEAERLIEHVDSSVEALDSLFVALLDISRLDAGIVQSQVRSFAIGPMLERIGADHASEALGKGIGLRLHPCSATVRSDPVLVERIVRNIVSNAVRYTPHGRVVIGCRRGARLSVEVWDTGRGIPPESRERVFEEFYQLENPERDRAKGLGLGLAIVKRLTVLLDCPLTLASVPGKGTVLKLSLQLADAAAPPDEPLTAPLPRAASAGLILVVDDETAIQEAMRSLLTSWGHDVIVAGSCEQMLERIADCAKRPDLIVSDYRLRGNEDGIAVIQRLRSEFNADIPALLITGDTGPERLKEAQESGFLLLHKPVPRGKLRAAIGNLMGAEVGDAE